jgi:hypothetical protein
MVTNEPALEAENLVAGPSNGLKTMEELEERLRNGLDKVTSPDRSDSVGQVIERKDYDFSGRNPGRMLRVKHDNVKIRNCKFRNNKGQPAVVIANAKNVVIEDCIFENITVRDGTNREPLRIGEDGGESGMELKCKVRRCIFRNNTAEAETISIKSANNTIEHCFFINNDGNLTVRHGGRTIIHHNYFRGNNGVRIYGYGNRVEYNCFENNSGGENRSPIGLWYGNEDKDQNWEWEDEEKMISRPKGGDPRGNHDEYARAVDTIIKGNEFKNCNNDIVEVKDGRSREPKRTKSEDNEKVEKFTFEKNEE